MHLGREFKRSAYTHFYSPNRMRRFWTKQTIVEPVKLFRFIVEVPPLSKVLPFIISKGCIHNLIIGFQDWEQFLLQKPVQDAEVGYKVAETLKPRKLANAFVV